MDHFLFKSLELINSAYESTLSRKSARESIGKFHNFLKFNFWKIDQPSSIKIWHLKAFVVYMTEMKLKPGTQKNKLSHVRTIIEADGRPGFARGPLLSNEALGVRKRSRLGSKRPVSLDAIVDFMIATNIPEWAGCSVLLCYFCGLRLSEAICQTPEIYNQWSESIYFRKYIHVEHHAKNGRPRYSIVCPNHRFISSIICSRMADLAKCNGGFIAQYHNGTRVIGKKKSIQRFSTLTSAKGLMVHRCRYSYANNSFEYSREKNKLEDQALLDVVLSLGHGPSRTAWVKGVYCRNIFIDKVKLPENLKISLLRLSAARTDWTWLTDFCSNLN